ncbi:hypothetical protein TWF694_005100 [Orbilia ellipsospora]|uniref:Uncharacterized protein n=1 Tax=Orbilia ellipsospora TaxID=2528407 RepID=A0AAV9WUW2_9PEZI
MKLITTHSVSIYAFLCLPQLIPAFWFEAAFGKGAFFSRSSALKMGSGKPETRDFYSCGRMGELYLSHPVDGVVVWNRPGSFATLAFALYYGRDCIRVRGGFSAHPQVILLMDPLKLRGIHLADIQALGIQPECKSWQAVKVTAEVQAGGALHGLDPQRLPGSIVYWDRQGIRHVKRDGIKWINAVAYEELNERRSIGMLLRDVLERYLHPDLAAHPGAKGTKKLMEYVNTKINILGDELYTPPIGGLWESDMTLPVNDTYDVIVSGPPVDRQPPATDPAPATIPDKSGARYKMRGASWLDIQDLDLTNTRTETHKPELIANRPVLKSALVRSFNRVPDRPEDKLLWYKLLEAQMVYNLKTFGTAARILWAWQKAWGELHPEELTEQINSEGIAMKPSGENTNWIESSLHDITSGVPPVDSSRLDINKEQMGNRVEEITELTKGPSVQEMLPKEMEIKMPRSKASSDDWEIPEMSIADESDQAYERYIQQLVNEEGNSKLRNAFDGWTMQNFDIGRWLDERIDRTEREEAYERLREEEEGMDAFEDPEWDEEESVQEYSEDGERESGYTSWSKEIYRESPGDPGPSWTPRSKSEFNPEAVKAESEYSPEALKMESEYSEPVKMESEYSSDAVKMESEYSSEAMKMEPEDDLKSEYMDYDAEDDLAVRKKRKPN